MFSLIKLLVSLRGLCVQFKNFLYHYEDYVFSLIKLLVSLRGLCVQFNKTSCISLAWLLLRTLKLLFVFTHVHFSLFLIHL